MDGGDADTLMRSAKGAGPHHSYVQLLKMAIDLPDDPLFAPTGGPYRQFNVVLRHQRGFNPG